jgi:hypothetical protein
VFVERCMSCAFVSVEFIVVIFEDVVYMCGRVLHCMPENACWLGMHQDVIFCLHLSMYLHVCILLVYDLCVRRGMWQACFAVV